MFGTSPFSLTPFALNNQSSATEIFEQEINDSLSFTEDILANFVRFVSIDDELTFDEDITGTTAEVNTIDDSLTLTESPSSKLIRLRQLTDSLTVTQTLTNTQVRRRTISDNILFDETINIINSGLIYNTDSLTLSETLSTGHNYNRQLTDTLTIQSSLLTNKSTGDITLSTFDQSLNIVPMTYQKISYDNIHKYTNHDVISYDFELTPEERRTMQRFIARNFSIPLTMIDPNGDLYQVRFYQNKNNELNAYEFYPPENLNITVDFIGEKIGVNS